jgi:hypothetical protein
LHELVVAGTRYATRAEITSTRQLVQPGKVEPIVGARFRLKHLDEAPRRARELVLPAGELSLSPMSQRAARVWV